MRFRPDKVVIYSVGLLGGSLGLGLKASGFTGTIAGVSSAKGLAVGREIKCIDEGYTYEDVAAALVDADLLILCSPIKSIIATIEKLAHERLPKGLVITDVGSTKQEIMAAAKKLPSQVHFIGGHPMAGSEKSGPSASDPYLFQNAIFVLTPSNGAPTAPDHDLAHFFEEFLGCRTLFLDAGVHDRVVATVSHVPHLLAVALVNLVQAEDDAIPGTLDLAAGGFRDMTRIASSSYDLWHDIFTTNKQAISPLMDNLIARLTEMKARLHSDTLQELFASSHETRARIPANAKGFIRQLSEILVVAKDQPGMISAIAGALSQANINIKDIEVLKVREGEGGTIRLAFDSQEIACRAVERLQASGFSARERT